MPRDTIKRHKDCEVWVKKINVGGTEQTATAAEVNAVCDGNTATAAEITSLCDGCTVTAAQLNAMYAGLVPKTDITTVDSSAGGTAQSANCTLVPADSLLLNVQAVVATAMDGDTTKTFEVGVSGNTDAYIDPSDFDPSAAANTDASMIGGTNNDEKAPQYLAAATQLVATWTNTASATAGSTKVIVTYIDLSP
jgi:hypothetical protein